jgi:hypothetical protein
MYSDVCSRMFIFSVHILYLNLNFENGATLPLFFQLLVLDKYVLQKILLQLNMGKPNLTDTLLNNQFISEYLIILLCLF